jgi:hypothetical protein
MGYDATMFRARCPACGADLGHIGGLPREIACSACGAQLIQKSSGWVFSAALAGVAAQGAAMVALGTTWARPARVVAAACFLVFLFALAVPRQLYLKQPPVPFIKA